jgi:23S rRNA pseudouridine1911/1915/1917 synthase
MSALENASGDEGLDDLREHVEGEPPGEDEPQEHVEVLQVGHRAAGKRIDRFLQDRFPRTSRTIHQRLIKQGMVTVNGLPTKPSYSPVTGDEIRIVLPPPPPSEVVPQDIPIDILYEDDWLIVLNKRTGIVCHPAHGTQTGTVANAVAFHAKTLSRGSEPFRPGIVHRLDKNTTGVMLIAKNDEAHWRVSLQFERRTVRKEYVAICEGEMRLDGDVINKPLAPHPETTKRMILPSANPPRQAMFKEAITEYRVEKRYRGFTVVRMFPKTGRTHQLRVHMSSIGHPIAGDGLYGGRHISERDLAGTGSVEPLITHQALHAQRLSLMHPILEKPLNVEAPLPVHMTRIIDLLEQYRRA